LKNSVLIAGLAKTGTTALLYKIEGAIEGEKRLMFEPKVFQEQPGDAGRSLLCKILIGPKLDLPSFGQFRKKITLVRDPRDRLVSSLLYSQFHASYVEDEAKVAAVRKLLEQKEAEPASVPVLAIVEAMGRAHGSGEERVQEFLRRTKLNQRWLEEYEAATRGAFTLRYEDFVAGNLAELEGYLGFRLAREAEVPERFNRVVRTKTDGDWKNWFTAQDVEPIREAIGDSVQRYGYDPSWDLPEKQVIRPEHCSQYYMRLIEERRAKLREEQAQGGAAARPRVRKPAPAARPATAERPAAARRGGFALRTGVLDGVTAKRVWGWAVGGDPARPVELALAVNGAVKRSFIADQPRPRLVERGVHPDGRCGFDLALGDIVLKPGDEVAVSVVGDSFKIRNSPAVVEETVPAKR